VALKKKAVFFTMIALFITVLIMAFFTTHDTFRYRDRSNSIITRVRTINAFIDDFESDLDREMFIGGYRAILSMNLYIREIGGYIDDFDSVFTQVMINGSINDTELLMKQEGQGADIKSWLERINEESSELGIVVEVEVNDIHLHHVDSWNVEMILDADVQVRDVRGLAEWRFNKMYKRKFSILGFEDPVYIVGTSDRLTNLINRTPDTDFVDDTNDTTILNTHLMNSYYLNTTDSPSYLMRFEGNFSDSKYGIESMVNLEELQGIIGKKDKSVIDHIYFSNKTTSGDKCNITGPLGILPGWFRIDPGNVNTYEIDVLSYQGC